MLSTTLVAMLLAATPPAVATIEIDGSFMPDEWAGAAFHPLGSDATVRMARDGQDLLIGLQPPPNALLYADVYVEDGAGTLRNFHASMQQGERVLTPGWTDSAPAFRWGPLPGWQTSIARRTGAGADSPLAEQLEPYDGYELRLPAAQLGPPPWRLRVELRDFEGSRPDLVWPADSTRVPDARWHALTLD